MYNSSIQKAEAGGSQVTSLLCNPGHKFKFKANLSYIVRPCHTHTHTYTHKKKVVQYLHKAQFELQH
jgi:hypothetical protein